MSLLIFVLLLCAVAPVMSPADQPSFQTTPRSTEPPTLWLSLVLGSVLIHLVLFILGTLAFTRTAKVQVDAGPITVEFVEPNAVTARSTAASSTATSKATAARSRATASSNPAKAQTQSNAARSQTSAINPSISSSLNPAVEQPFVPQPRPRSRTTVRTRQPQPSRNPARPSRTPVPLPTSNPATTAQPSPDATRTPPPSPFPSSPFTPSPFPPSPSSPDTQQTQPSSNSSQEPLPGTQSNPSGSSDPLPAGAPSPVEGERISQGPQGESAIVNVLGTSPPPIDVPTQLAQPTVSQQNVLIRYPAFLAKQTIRLQAMLIISQTGRVLDIQNETLLFSSLGSGIDHETLHEVANQIFTQWQFSPAKDTSDDGKLLTPPQSNLLIEVQVQMP